jgi:hypothetical protein
VDNTARMNVLAVVSNNVLPFEVNKLYDAQYINIAKISTNITADLIKRGRKLAADYRSTKVYSLSECVHYDIINDNFIKKYNANVNATIPIPAMIIDTSSDYAILNEFSCSFEELADKQVLDKVPIVDMNKYSITPYQYNYIDGKGVCII